MTVKVLFLALPFLVAVAVAAPAASAAPCGQSAEPMCTPTGPKLRQAKHCSRGYSTEYGAIFAYEIYVRGISCRGAQRALAGVSIDETQSGPTGWRCRTVGRVYEGSIKRCAKGRRYMQFHAGV
jgi:hypothetical protein